MEDIHHSENLHLGHVHSDVFDEHISPVLPRQGAVEHCSAYCD